MFQMIAVPQGFQKALTPMLQSRWCRIGSLCSVFLSMCVYNYLYAIPHWVDKPAHHTWKLQYILSAMCTVRRRDIHQGNECPPSRLLRLAYIFVATTFTAVSTWRRIGWVLRNSDAV